MTVNLPTHKSERSNQLAEYILTKKIESQTGQREDLLPKRMVRADANKILREIFHNDANRDQVFGDRLHKTHRCFAENPWIKDTHLGSDSILLKLLRDVEKNYSS